MCRVYLYLRVVVTVTYISWGSNQQQKTDLLIMVQFLLLEFNINGSYTIYQILHVNSPKHINAQILSIDSVFLYIPIYMIWEQTSHE